MVNDYDCSFGGIWIEFGNFSNKFFSLLGSPLTWIQHLVSAGIPVQGIVPLFEQNVPAVDGQVGLERASAGQTGATPLSGWRSEIIAVRCRRLARVAAVVLSCDAIYQREVYRREG